MVAVLILALAVVALWPSGWPLRIRRLPRDVEVRDVGIVAAFVALALVAGLAVHTAVTAAALALGALVAFRRSRRTALQRRLRRSLPGVAEGLAAATRAGLPLPDALSAVAIGHPPEVALALRRSAALLRLGRPLEEAAASLDAAFGPAALLVRETLRAFHRRGGNVARALERSAALIRSEAELQDEIHALTAQGRASALVLALLAPFGLLFFIAVDPAAVQAFITDARGQSLLSAALLLEGVGALWLWRLVRR